MSNFLSDQKNFKAVVAFCVSTSIDKYIYKSPNIKNTLILASVAGTSNYIASSLQSNNMIPSLQIIEAYNSETINIKTIEQRIIEISLSGLGAYTVNNQILKNIRQNITLQDCLMLFVAPSLIAEYVTDYYFGQKLSYLS